MSAEIGHQIRIKTRVDFREEYTYNAQEQFVYSYHIRIDNNSNCRIQLLRRYWQISDVMGEIREVEGEGVIGLQPILEPGQSHQYESWCALNSDTGAMSGHYIFKDLASSEEFKVAIPEFTLIPNFLLN